MEGKGQLLRYIFLALPVHLTVTYFSLSLSFPTPSSLFQFYWSGSIVGTHLSSFYTHAQYCLFQEATKCHESIIKYQSLYNLFTLEGWRKTNLWTLYCPQKKDVLKILQHWLYHYPLNLFPHILILWKELLIYTMCTDLKCCISWYFWAPLNIFGKCNSVMYKILLYKIFYTLWNNFYWDLWSGNNILCEYFSLV